MALHYVDGCPVTEKRALEFLHEEAGRRFVCAAVFPNTEDGTKRANAFMERTPGTGVLCISDAIYIAHNDDNGVEVPQT